MKKKGARVEEVAKAVGKVKIPGKLASKLGSEVSKLDNWLAKYADDLGEDATKLLDEVDGLIGKKSVINISDEGLNGEMFIQITRADKTNTVVAIQKTAPTHSVHKGKYISVKYEPAYKPNANLDYDVPLSKNGITPDYARTSYLHPLNKGKTIRIEMSGTTRDIDFARANAEMKKLYPDFKKKPRDGYTWHHMDDFYYDPTTGKSYCTMQLVKSEVHSAKGMTHSGSVTQMEKFLGIRYKK